MKLARLCRGKRNKWGNTEREGSVRRLGRDGWTKMKPGKVNGKKNKDGKKEGTMIKRGWECGRGRRGS